MLYLYTILLSVFCVCVQNFEILQGLKEASSVEKLQISSRCQPDEFQCNSGLCIKANLRCNGYVECPDRSDEKRCARSIPAGFKICRKGFKLVTGICTRQSFIDYSYGKKDLCHLPSETGVCSNYTERWYYDTKEKTCRLFYYGGCGGNGNNFGAEDACLKRCEVVLEEQTPAPPIQEPTIINT